MGRRESVEQGTRPNANDEVGKRLSVRPAIAARMLSVSRSAIYDLLNSGQLRSRACGSARLIPVGELERWLAEDT